MGKIQITSLFFFFAKNANYSEEIPVLSLNRCCVQCHTWFVHFFNISVQGLIPNVFC